VRGAVVRRRSDTAYWSSLSAGLSLCENMSAVSTHTENYVARSAAYPLQPCASSV